MRFALPATVILGFFCIGIAACSRETPSEPAAATAVAIPVVADYTYEDRYLWQALPQKDYDFAGEALPLRYIEQPQADGAHVFLFIGETAEPNNGDALVMQRLAELNPRSAVWFIDTPDALFIERDRLALRNQQGEFMAPILQQLTVDFASFTLITMDVASVPVLRGLRKWQSEANENQLNRLAQIVMLYPSLYVNTPVAGQSRQLFPIARNTALPITVIQPQLGAQANTIEESLSALREDGSLVILQRIEEATDGIYKWQDIRKFSPITAQMISDSEQQMRALRAQDGYRITRRPPFAFDRCPQSTIVAGLKPVNGELPMQNIVLEDLDGHRVDLLRDYAGKALLLTFWATWCPHCVEEIPSMNRALAKLDREHFAIVSVAYRDTPQIMKAFRKKLPMDFPVLMDLDGSVSAQWKVYSFPSSFLVDRSGRIRYSINTGALWDSPEMLEALRAISADASAMNSLNNPLRNVSRISPPLAWSQDEGTN